LGTESKGSVLTLRRTGNLAPNLRRAADRLRGGSNAPEASSSVASASSIRFGPRLEASALCALGLGCLAALVGALDTRRVCVGILEAMCDGPNWGEALVAFGLACALLTVGVVLVVRLRRGA
jgi:hypothetical protein